MQITKHITHFLLSTGACNPQHESWLGRGVILSGGGGTDSLVVLYLFSSLYVFYFFLFGFAVIDTFHYILYILFFSMVAYTFGVINIDPEQWVTWKHQHQQGPVLLINLVFFLYSDICIVCIVNIFVHVVLLLYILYILCILHTWTWGDWWNHIK